MFDTEKAVVEQYYAELNGPTEGIDPMPLFAPSLRHEVKGSTPISGVRHYDDMVKYWASLRENYAVMETTAHELLALEDGRIFARSRSICQPRGAGKVYDQSSVYVFTVTDGKISDIVKTYEDTASMIDQWG